jgi:hypothetical protein
VARGRAGGRRRLDAVRKAIYPRCSRGSTDPIRTLGRRCSSAVTRTRRGTSARLASSARRCRISKPSSDSTPPSCDVRARSSDAARDGNARRTRQSSVSLGVRLSAQCTVVDSYAQASALVRRGGDAARGGDGDP